MNWDFFQRTIGIYEKDFDLVGDIRLFTVWKREVGKINRVPLGK